MGPSALAPAAPNPWPSAPTSMGSPRGVPVPWMLTRPTSVGAARLDLRAALIRALCEGPLGAVSPLDRPSCTEKGHFFCHDIA